MSKQPSSNYLSQAWLVLLLAILYGGGLAFVNSTLSPIIAENQKQETYSLIPALVGNPGEHSVTEVPMPLSNGGSTILYHVSAPDSTGIGWVIPSSALGFADNIRILVGIDNTCSRIIGMRVIDQKETPGLGNLIVEASFTNQFADKPTEEPFKVVKMAPGKASEILTVTGATISSVTVAVAVNEAISQARPFISEYLLQ